MGPTRVSGKSNLSIGQLGEVDQSSHSVQDSHTCLLSSNESGFLAFVISSDDAVKLWVEREGEFISDALKAIDLTKLRTY